MPKKSSNKKLLIVFGVLLLLVAITFSADFFKKDSNYKSDLFTLDSAKISSITIYPKRKNEGEIKFTKTGKDVWNLTQKGKSYVPDKGGIQNLIDELLRIKPERIAATDKSLWSKYEVTDTSGIRVTVEQEGKIVADLIIGKFSYQQNNQADPNMQMNPYMMNQPKITSYVRLNGENDVYGVQGLLSMTFGRDLNSYRNKTIISSNKMDWTKVTATFPGDSSFVLTNNGTIWNMENAQADSTKINNYIQTIEYVTSSEFADEIKPNAWQALYTLTIDKKDKTQIKVQVFPGDAKYKFIVQTTENPNVNFGSAQENIVGKIFVSKFSLLPTVEVSKK